MATLSQVFGKNSAAPFVLKIHRGEGMVLLAMDCLSEALRIFDIIRSASRVKRRPIPAHR